MRRLRSTADYPMTVCVVFTVITVVNSAMMLLGWDEPKAGPFAYVHLLSRLLIIAFVVALFFVDDLRVWAKERRAVRRPGARRRMKERFAGPIGGVATAFTLVTSTACLLAIAWSTVAEVHGGRALYRNLLILAAALIVGRIVFALVPRRRPPAPAA